MIKLQVGDKAPKFSTQNQKNETISYQDFKGKKTVLYFYPKDDTSTCTAESCNLRDNHNVLQAAGYQVFGISPQGTKSHKKFIDKYDLPFDLLIDEDHVVAEAFGVWGEKSMYGRTYMGIIRTTFLFDEKGKITDIIEKVKAKEHHKQI
jgi:peroxiredoxin Q/BCP